MSLRAGRYLPLGLLIDPCKSPVAHEYRRIEPNAEQQLG